MSFFFPCRSKIRLWCVLAIACPPALFRCGSSNPEPIDSIRSQPPSGTSDAGAADAGSTDAGALPDGGTAQDPDASSLPPDGGSIAPSDGGTAPGADGGISSSPDGGAPDAGTTLDAGTPPNRAPSLNVATQYNVALGGALYITVVCIDPDNNPLVECGPEGALPTGATWTSGTRLFAYAPAAAGDVSVVFLASDGALETRITTRFVTPAPTDPPPMPTLTGASPAGPANNNAPAIRGSALYGTTVTLYTSAACSGAPVATGAAADFNAAGITVSVTDNSTTSFYARAALGGLVSPCSTTSATYVEDSAPPAAPVVTGTNPASPSADLAPRVLGTAEAGATVRVYANATCAGTATASGTATNFATTGIAVTVAEDQSTDFTATATDVAGNTSACSSTKATYVTFPKATRIALGYIHGCAVTTRGALRCWGGNGFGELGNNTTVRSPTPVSVQGFASGGVSEVAAGYFHTCALTTAKGMKCWGYGGYGALGTNGSSSKYTPTDVMGLTSGVQAIATGWLHTCAIVEATGGVKCWGYNGNGQVSGSETYNYSPVDVTGLTSGAAAIAAGPYTTCAVTNAGGVKCWGYNGAGNVGNGSFTSSVRTPSDVVGLASGVVSVAVSYAQTCALLSTGAVRCWGNGYGATPVTVSGLSSGVVAVAAGTYTVVAIKQDGSVVTWGANHYGQGGDGNRTQSWSYTTLRAATAVTGRIASLGIGLYTSCVITETGSPRCFGQNYHGQLGDGTLVERLSPAAVSGLPSTGVAELALGSDFGCARTQTGGVKCWGANSGGQAGDGTKTTRASAVDATGLSSGISSIASSSTTSFALKADGSAVAWGTTGGTTPSAYPALGTGNRQVAAGESHQCVLTSANGVKCRGPNFYGQLGNSSTLYSSSLVDVTGLTSGVKSISAAGYTSCAVTTSGGAKCWGYNPYGNLGNGSTASYSSAPVDVTGLTSGVDFVAAHQDYACAALSAGGVKCWGNSNFGRLGNGTTTWGAQRTPVSVNGLSSVVTSLGLNYYRACARTTAGGVTCWGHNYSVAYGGAPALPTYWLTATDYPGLVSGVASVAASPGYSDPILCAVMNTGAATCVGPDWNGTATGVFPGIPRPVSGFVP